MKIKLSSKSGVHVFDVSFKDDDGNSFKNRELPESEQVTVDFKRATISQKTRFIGSYSVRSTKKSKSNEYKSVSKLDYESALRENGGTIRNMEDLGIKTSINLLEKQGIPEIDEMIHDLFMKIIGAHDDDAEQDEFENESGNELTDSES